MCRLFLFSYFTSISTTRTIHYNVSLLTLIAGGRTTGTLHHSLLLIPPDNVNFANWALLDLHFHLPLQIHLVLDHRWQVAFIQHQCWSSSLGSGTGDLIFCSSVFCNKHWPSPLNIITKVPHNSKVRFIEFRIVLLTEAVQSDGLSTWKSTENKSTENMICKWKEDFAEDSYFHSTKLSQSLESHDALQLTSTLSMTLSTPYHMLWTILLLWFWKNLKVLWSHAWLVSNLRLQHWLLSDQKVQMIGEWRLPHTTLAFGLYHHHNWRELYYHKDWNSWEHLNKTRTEDGLACQDFVMEKHCQTCATGRLSSISKPYLSKRSSEQNGSLQLFSPRVLHQISGDVWRTWQMCLGDLGSLHPICHESLARAIHAYMALQRDVFGYPFH